MKNISLSLTVLLLMFVTSQINSQNISSEKSEILELQDKRTFGENDRLIKYLHSSDPEIRRAALYALANIGDSSVIGKLDLFSARDYPSDEELKAAAFLLGQIPCEESRNALNFLLDNSNDFKEQKYSVISEILNAIGKTGNENDLDKISSHILLYSGQDTALLVPAAMSVGRFALRKIKNEKSVDALKFIVNHSKDIPALRNCAFAFWRTGDRTLLEKASEEIYTLAESEDAQTRMWAYNALGRLKNNLFLMYTLESFNSENDWRVKVNMLNSFTNFELDSIPELTEHLLDVFADGISDDNEHVSITAINVLGKMFSDLKNTKNEYAATQSAYLKKQFLYSLDSVKNLSWRVRSELANSMSLVFRDEMKDELLKRFSKSEDYDFKSGIISAIVNFNNGNVYKEVRDSISKDIMRYNLKNPNTEGELIGSPELAKLYRAFTAMLAALDDKINEEDRNTVRLMFSEFVSSKDPVIVDNCLTALKDSMYADYIDETNSVIAFDYSELTYPKDLDVMLAFIDAMGEMKNTKAVEILENNLSSENYEIGKYSADALKKITGKDYSFTAKPRYNSEGINTDNILKIVNVTLKTNKGDVKIELLPEAAPFTVMNFIKLSENKFYNGTVFHRVVSNFVIQGGDPGGTGYGGPGYSIRSEFSPLTYERGMVGMASSGKDTEGSQFFITHSATPHLDGRYTIFGKVIGGMDVVDEIMTGDSVVDVIFD